MLQPIFSFFLDIWNASKYNMFYIICIIVSLTFLQRFHFYMIGYIKSKMGFLGRLISFINRLGVIIHEFAHLFFLLLAGAKVDNVNLFAKDGGSVQFSSSDYLSALPYANGKGFMFFFIMFFQKVLLYCAYAGPLIVGMILNIFIVNLLFGGAIFTSEFQFDTIRINFWNGIIIIIYCIFLLPYFILSYKDISNFIIYNGDNILEKIIGGIINGIIFLIFLIPISYFFSYFLSFFVFYVISLVITFLIFLTIKILAYFIDKEN